jgi:hypothetical protein
MPPKNTPPSSGFGQTAFGQIVAGADTVGPGQIVAGVGTGPGQIAALETLPEPSRIVAPGAVAAGQRSGAVESGIVGAGQISARADSGGPGQIVARGDTGPGRIVAAGAVASVAARQRAGAVESGMEVRRGHGPVFRHKPVGKRSR